MCLFIIVGLLLVFLLLWLLLLLFCFVLYLSVLCACENKYVECTTYIHHTELLFAFIHINTIHTHTLPHTHRNTVMNLSLLFETGLAAGLCYITPLNDGLGTRPIKFTHWLPGLPFSMFIFFYDEIRKGVIRKNPDGWLYQTTYW